MSFTSFFSKQARKPEGFFGRFVMKLIFDRGNTFLNNFVEELLEVQTDDRIFELGSGTGKLISQLAPNIDGGYIEAIDFSAPMVAIARKRNNQNIARGKVKIVEGNFDELPHKKACFTKACSVNTLYFWSKPEQTALKLAEILKPGGSLVLAFEDFAQLKQRKLDQDVFNFYSTYETEDLLRDAGFSQEVTVVSRKKGSAVFHCIVATK
ncbi:MAG: class I SAM-dependent methyltransferase [Desulfobulbaceae bacterium]|nr:MAG: class I SAM-dependent methyltransferase [Desulfobulbaceae bacterium]